MDVHVACHAQNLAREACLIYAKFRELEKADIYTEKGAILLYFIIGYLGWLYSSIRDLAKILGIAERLL